MRTASLPLLLAAVASASAHAAAAVLIADTENHVIRRYTPGDGMIHRVAGTGEKGAGGLGGPPESCQLDRPHGALLHPTPVRSTSRTARTIA